MTKVAVTGHTSGLGKFIFEFYQRQGAEVTGYSTSTGFDLRNWDSLQRLLQSTQHCDIIVSNAKPDFFQTVFLYEFVRRQNFKPKIVSIGSQIINFDVDIESDVGINLYKTQKLALKNAHDQLTHKYVDLQSILIHPGHLYDNDGTVYTDIPAWVEKMHTIINSRRSGEICVQ